MGRHAGAHLPAYGEHRMGQQEPGRLREEADAGLGAVRSEEWPEALVGALAFAALLLHPTQVTVRQWADALVRVCGTGGRIAELVPSVHVCVSDVLFLLAFGVWAAAAVARGQLWRRLSGYPVPLLALLACATLSAAPFLKPPALLGGRQFVFSRAAREFIQMAVLFVCAFVVLADRLGDSAWRRRLTAAFVLACAAAVAVGLAEYVRLRPDAGPAASADAIVSPVSVDATFGFRGEAAGPHEQVGTLSNRNVLGAWASLALPFLWALALCLEGPWAAACGLVATAGQVLLLQGALWLFTCAAMLGVAYVRGRRAFTVTAVGLFVLWALIFQFAPQQHSAVLLDSLMLRRAYDRYHTLPVYGEQPAGKAPAVLSEAQGEVWRQQYVEWQAGLQALGRDPLFGVGLGNYQNNINTYYEARSHHVYNPEGVYNVPKPARNLMEPGANSFYLVWAVETGLAGLFAWLWVWMSGLRKAAHAWRTGAGGLERGLALGSLAGLCAMAGGLAFTNYLVRGVGVAVVFLLAAAYAPGQESQSE
jgi:hypothetical protein